MTMIRLTRPTGTYPAPRPFDIALWAVQAFLALLFIWAGCAKLIAPAGQLARMLPWAAEDGTLVPVAGMLAALGGLGILLPTLTRVRPSLTLSAAVGLCILLAMAMMFHLSRGEIDLAAANVVLLAMSVFVLWGRGMAAPVAPRA